MSEDLYYKNVPLSDLIEGGSTSLNTLSDKFTTSITCAGTTTNAWEKNDANTGFPEVFLVNGAKPFKDLKAKTYNIGDNNTIAIPSWADAFKLEVKSKKGSDGNDGNDRTDGHTDTAFTGKRSKPHYGGQGGTGGKGNIIRTNNAVSITNAAGGSIQTSKSGNNRYLKIVQPNNNALYTLHTTTAQNGNDGGNAVVKFNGQNGHDGADGSSGNDASFSDNFPSSVITDDDNSTPDVTENSNKIHFFKI